MKENLDKAIRNLVSLAVTFLFCFIIALGLAIFLSSVTAYIISGICLVFSMFNTGQVYGLTQITELAEFFDVITEFMEEAGANEDRPMNDNITHTN